MTSPRKLLLAAPLYGGTMHIGFHTSVCATMLAAAKAKVYFNQKFVGCDSLVPRARNRCVDYFLASDYTDLLFVDADITFNPADALRMLTLDEPIVGGAYPRKQLDWGRIAAAARAGVLAADLPRYGFIPVMNWLGLPSGEPYHDYPLDSLIEVKHLGTGFLRIRRAVFESVIAQCGDRIAFDYASEEEGFAGRTGYEFFPIGPDIRYPLGSGARQYLSEDWAFCELARACGFKLHVDPRISLTHSGTHDFTGDLNVLDASNDELTSAPASAKGESIATIP